MPALDLREAAELLALSSADSSADAAADVLAELAELAGSRSEELALGEELAGSSSLEDIAA